MIKVLKGFYDGLEIKLPRDKRKKIKIHDLIYCAFILIVLIKACKIYMCITSKMFKNQPTVYNS